MAVDPLRSPAATCKRREDIVRVVTIAILILLFGAGYGTDVAAAGHKSGAALVRQVELREAAARAAARVARREAARDRARRREAEAIAYFSRMYGAGVGRYYPLVHRYFPGYERDALYVMRGESGGDRRATTGTCWSLWQLNECHAAAFRRITGHAFFWGVLVPEYSAEMTAYMTDGGRNWSAWSVRP